MATGGTSRENQPDPVLQEDSQGISGDEIYEAALGFAEPGPGLSWLDIGCGRGALLRRIRDRHEPSQLTGVDILDWLDSDLREIVQFVRGPAETVAAQLPSADRVLLVESIEHLEAPWTTLRTICSLVVPGGMLVLTTPNVTSLRHRLELLARGQLTSFRPSYASHLTPIVLHAVRRVLQDEGLSVAHGYAARDIIPFTGGRLYPYAIHRRARQLTSISLVVVGRRPRN